MPVSEQQDTPPLAPSPPLAGDGSLLPLPSPPPVPATPDGSGGGRLLEPSPCRVCYGMGGALVPGVVNCDPKRLKIVFGARHAHLEHQRECADVEATLRLPLRNLLDCRLALEEGAAASADAVVQLRYSAALGGVECSLELHAATATAAALLGVLSPFVPAAGRAMRAALHAHGWGSAFFGRGLCFSHGDPIPALIATRGQQFHEAEGELRYVLADQLGRHGVDLQLKVEAKTLGVWQTIRRCSLHAAEFSLAPAPAEHGTASVALCLQRQVDGNSGAVAVEDFLILSNEGVTQKRRYCSGPYCIAETTRVYRFTAADSPSAASDIAAAERPAQPRILEVRVTGSHRGHDGKALYRFRVELEGPDGARTHRSVAKRYSGQYTLPAPCFCTPLPEPCVCE